MFFSQKYLSSKIRRTLKRSQFSSIFICIIIGPTVLTAQISMFNNQAIITLALVIFEKSSNTTCNHKYPIWRNGIRRVSPVVCNTLFAIRIISASDIRLLDVV